MASTQKTSSLRKKTKKAVRYAKGYSQYHLTKLKQKPKIIVAKIKYNAKNFPVIEVLKSGAKTAHQAARDFTYDRVREGGKRKIQGYTRLATVKSTQTLAKVNPGEMVHTFIDDMEKLGYKHAKLAGERTEKFVMRKTEPIKKKALRAEKRITRDTALVFTKIATNKFGPGMKGWE